MKRLVLTLVAFTVTLSAAFHCAAQVDTSRFKELDSKLEEYYRTLEREKVEVKNEECDKLIEAAKDPALRQHIALHVYEHYLNSPVMGDEAVAIHMTDTWFAPGKVAMGSETALTDALVYAEFNRESLLGMQAPGMDLFDPDSVSVHFGGRSERYRILLFYDTDCSRCRAETIFLKSLLRDKDYPVDLYAVNTGQDREAWQRWIAGRFDIDAPDTRVFNLWDPSVSSDYQRKYGVLQTPRMFLVNPRGTIVGRGMDTEALGQLVEILLSREDYSYGSDAMNSFFDSLLAPFGNDLSKENILQTARMLADGALAKEDTLLYKHAVGDLLYYLVPRKDEASKEATLPFVNEYILSRPDIWDTPDDSLKVIGMASMEAGILSLSPVGSRIPKICALKGWNALRRKGGHVIFHTEGCPVCAREEAAMDSLGIRYLSVDLDELTEKKPRVAEKLLSTFDLSTLPMIMEVAPKGIVKRRYLSFLQPSEQ